MISVKLAGNDSELEGILALQRLNLRRNLAATEAAREGFLTAEYTLEYLRKMNQEEPSVIAVAEDQVVGYALAATQPIREGNPLLADLFRQIDLLHFNGEPLRQTNYVVVGQLCVAKAFRGIGLVRRLYGQFRHSMQTRFRYAITDVARDNRRSLEAHRRTGFQTIHSITFEGLQWEVVLWDWTDPASAPARETGSPIG